MAYTATPEDIQKIRFELNDNEAGLYILADDVITYYLEKNSGGIARTSLECAKAILFRLSMDARDEQVDVLSLKGSKTAEQYRLALELYVKNPSLNPLMGNASLWVGGVSKAEIKENNENTDNNINPLSLSGSEYSDVNDSYFTL